MLTDTLLHHDRVPDGLLAALDRRDVALWICDLPKDRSSRQSLEKFVGLPWRLILSEVYDALTFRALEMETTFNDPMTRKAGLRRSLTAIRHAPNFLRGRRMTMLDALRRSGVRELLVISTRAAVPPDLTDLWASGFRCHLTFVSDDANAEKEIAGWLTTSGSSATLLSISTTQAIDGFYGRFTETYPEERRVLRIRDAQGTFHKIDVTEAEEPERPILDSYSLIEERDLAPLLPEDLTEENFVAFFRDSTSSWRPYAAGLPWLRDQGCRKTLGSYLAKLDAVRADVNCIAYISSESGAGGTTLARALAWEYAREGYPVLLARACSHY